jgi:predicted enzyme related to lactoylglutathione lyase
VFSDSKAFSTFSVNDMAVAEGFYGQTLGIVTEKDEMGLRLKLAGTDVFIYQKADHVPATFTVLNFIVDDIEQAIDELTAQGITMEQYSNPDMPQDERGILRGSKVGMGPDIAWFKDPAGNVLAVLQSAA